jgi:hypothetical protein
MRTYIVWSGLLIAILMSPGMTPHAGFAAAPENEERAWKIYTNARFGFSVRYPETWRLGNPLPDGVGVTLNPPIDNSLVALSGHMNLLEGKSQDRRQTLDEFAAAHRRIITELYGKKTITVKWRQDQEMSLAGFPAIQMTFTYSDSKQGDILERHIFSLGRNEGRGIRIKVPLSEETRVMPTIAKILETYQPGRDQNAVSPIVPKEDSAKTAPR